MHITSEHFSSARRLHQGQYQIDGRATSAISADIFINIASNLIVARGRADITGVLASMMVRRRRAWHYDRPMLTFAGLARHARL